MKIRRYPTPGHPPRNEQLKSIISALIPTPPVAVPPGLPVTEDGTPSLPPTRTVAKGKSAAPGTLPQLQLALVHSMFGARLKLTRESTMTDVQTFAKVDPAGSLSWDYGLA